jgi:hypothetical protein
MHLIVLDCFLDLNPTTPTKEKNNMKYKKKKENNVDYGPDHFEGKCF